MAKPGTRQETILSRVLLTPPPPVPIATHVSRPDGRCGKHRKVAVEESPGSMDKRCRITSGGACPRESGDRPQGQCHREQTACPVSARPARVKRCGKSAPRDRQRDRHGKPHREQDRIGVARASRRESGRRSRSVRISHPGRLLEAPGNRRPRGMAVTRGIRVPPYRTRLTGRLMLRMGARWDTAGPPPICGLSEKSTWHFCGCRLAARLPSS